MLTAASPTSSSSLFSSLSGVTHLTHSLFHVAHSALKYITVSQLKSVLRLPIVSYSQEEDSPVQRLKLLHLSEAVDIVDFFLEFSVPFIPVASFSSSSPGSFSGIFLCSVFNVMFLSDVHGPPLTLTWAAWSTSCSSWEGSALHTFILWTWSLFFQCICSTDPLAQGLLVPPYVQKVFELFPGSSLYTSSPKTLNRTSTIGSLMQSMILMFLSTFKLPTPWDEAALFFAISLCEGLNKHLSNEWMNFLCANVMLEIRR